MIRLHFFKRGRNQNKCPGSYGGSDKCVTLRYNGYIEANCDGCMAGLAEMYQDYIDGKRELDSVNMR